MILDKKLPYDNHIFDSTHEIMFYYWCKTAKARGWITDFKIFDKHYELTGQYHYAQEKQLKTQLNVDKRTLFQPWTYSCDFELEIHPSDLMHKFTDLVQRRKDPNTRRFPAIFLSSGNDPNRFLIDIKGAARRKGEQTSDIVFPIAQKMVYSKYGDYIHKVHVLPMNWKSKPKLEVFPNTFFPEEFWDELVYKRNTADASIGDLKPQLWIPQVADEFIQKFKS